MARAHPRQARRERLNCHCRTCWVRPPSLTISKSLIHVRFLAMGSHAPPRQARRERFNCHTPSCWVRERGVTMYLYSKHIWKSSCIVATMGSHAHHRQARGERVNCHKRAPSCWVRPGSQNGNLLRITATMGSRPDLRQAKRESVNGAKLDSQHPCWVRECSVTISSAHYFSWVIGTMGLCAVCAHPRQARTERLTWHNPPCLGRACIITRSKSSTWRDELRP